MELTPIQRARDLFQPTLFTRDDLLRQGLSSRQITRAVAIGQLVRFRRDRYARPGLADSIADAVRVGGRATCVTLMQLLGVFVLKASAVHVQVSRNSSRLGAPREGRCRIHWSSELDEDLLHVTALLPAIRRAVCCQSPRAALATLDSLVHHGLVTIAQLETLFADLPARLRPLLCLIDGSAGSGPETFVRLMLRTLGAQYETQVLIPGVGRVDFVVNGWLIIECDSKQFHEGWEKQKEDRCRDLAAAKLGYVTIRPLATDILHESAAVQEDLRQIIDVLGSKLDPSRSQFRKEARRQRRFAP